MADFFKQVGLLCIYFVNVYVGELLVPNRAFTQIRETYWHVNDSERLIPCYSVAIHNLSETRTPFVPLNFL